MTQFKGTPGPWSVAYSRSGYPYQIRAEHARDDVPGAVGKSVTRWAAISLPSSEEGLANAHLIAAAPALLEALERTLNWLSSYPGGGTMGPNGPYEQARAAIAQALGEQS